MTLKSMDGTGKLCDSQRSAEHIFILIEGSNGRTFRFAELRGILHARWVLKESEDVTPFSWHVDGNGGRIGVSST
jgi:hypothetical protein